MNRAKVEAKAEPQGSSSRRNTVPWNSPYNYNNLCFSRGRDDEIEGPEELSGRENAATSCRSDRRRRRDVGAV